VNMSELPYLVVAILMLGFAAITLFLPVFVMLIYSHVSRIREIMEAKQKYESWKNKQ